LEHRESAWRASVFANLGVIYRAHGFLGAALNAWDRAWVEAGAETEPPAQAVAGFALGGWVELSHQIGRATQIAERLDQIAGRPLSGRAAQKIALAREGVWVTRVAHEVLASGAAALESIVSYLAYEQRRPHAPIDAIQNYHSTAAGMSL